MHSISRRRFFRDGTLMAGASLSANSWLARSAQANETSSDTARLEVDVNRQISSMDRNLFGSFIEHLGRAVYGGIYEPGSPLSDTNGFRKDVLQEIKSLGVPIVRYPGGNFVSGYNWLDGVGPEKERPRVLDLAWNSIETNQFGTNEFVTWCRAAGAEPLMGTNLGSGSAAMCAALVEYCNVDRGTKWSDLRRRHGFEQPRNVKYWCLGNEMDGPWQIGHMPAPDYGIKARDAAHQMRAVDPTVELVACGSSTPALPTYLEWDRQILEECYDEVDALSLHRYFGNDEETGGDTSKYLALNLTMDREIEQILAVCEYVQGRKHTKKKLWLSFDEWNVWYRARGPAHDNGHRQVAPHLLEEVYNLEDALLVGGLLNTLIRHSDRVRIACLAQLVNVIAPIMTNETGLFRQTIYYPYAWALQYARGHALDLVPQSPSYQVEEVGEVAYLDVAGTVDSENQSVTLLILNRDLHQPRELTVAWRGAMPGKVNRCLTLTGSDLKATNGFEAPMRVVPQSLEPPGPGAIMTLQLPERSYSLVTVSLT
jgi:alpha-L-arabinofuranosidase